MYRSNMCYLFVCTIVLLASCAGKQSQDKTAEVAAPNILWFYVEDISPDLGCYGNDIVRTPNIDALAGHGIRFTNAITVAPVCSPARSAVITGMMQTTSGTHNHHSSRTEASIISLPEGVKTLPEIFREHGYFTFNQGKDDYNFAYTRDSLYSGKYRDNGMYGLVGLKVDWSLRKKDQPFFGQIQLSGNKYIYHKNFDEKVIRQINPDSLTVPIFYPQTEYMKEEWASYLESIELTDRALGEELEQLRKNGLLKNTYVFFFSDHGMRLWRHKQFLYEGGIKVPLILAYFDENGNPAPVKGKLGTKNADLISSLDIGITSLGLGNITIPSYAEGFDLLSDDYQEREFIISARDRCDFTIDRIRSVRTKNFKYIKNFMVDRPYMQPNYRDDWELTQTMRKAYANGELNELQARFWEQERPTEELYDLTKDPNEIYNLASDATEYMTILQKMRKILDDWVTATDDKGQYEENIEGLKFMYDIWGDRCVNPEYDQLKTN